MERGSPSSTAATHTATTTTEGTGVTAPGPTQTGIPDICNKWIMQKKDNYCQDMTDEAGTSLDCFYLNCFRSSLNVTEKLSSSVGALEGQSKGGTRYVDSIFMVETIAENAIRLECSDFRS